MTQEKIIAILIAVNVTTLVVMWHILRAALTLGAKSVERETYVSVAAMRIMLNDAIAKEDYETAEKIKKHLDEIVVNDAHVKIEVNKKLN